MPAGSDPLLHIEGVVVVVVVVVVVCGELSTLAF